MKDWLTAAELAALRLPELPATRFGVEKRAKGEQWRSRPRTGRGGGREYFVGSLPEAAIAVLRRQAIEAARQRVQTEPEGSPKPDPLPAADLTPRQAARFAARQRLLTVFEGWSSSAGIASVCAAQAAFRTLYNTGAELPGIDAEIRDAVPALGADALRRWLAARAAHGAAGLAGRYAAARKGSGAIDRNPPLRDFILALVGDKPHVNANHVAKAVAARFGAATPPLRTIQRWLAEWKAANAGAFLRLNDPDAYKSRRRPSFGDAAARVTGLNDRWELDSTPADVALKGADGVLRRHAVVGVIDVWSRRLMLLVSPTSRSTAIAAVLRRAVLAWGVPREIATDGGKDYTSAHLERICADLRLAHKTCAPFTPEGKPFIERALGTLARDLFERLPGYTGHNVAQAQAIRARKSFAQRYGKPEEATLAEIALTPAQLQEVCDGWAAADYGRTVHTALGMSPFDKAAGWTGAVRRIADERALDVLLAPVAGGDGWRVVGKKGLRLERAWYAAAELGGLVGERVQVRFDPAAMSDAADRLFVFDRAGRYVCAAPRVGDDAGSVATRARAGANARDGETVKAVRRLGRKLGVTAAHLEALQAAAAEADKVVAFRRAGEAHDTDALAAAAAAVADPGAGPEPTEISDDQRAAAEAEIVRLHAREAAPDPDDIPEDRRLLKDDRQWALWVMRYPDRATDADRARLGELMSDWSFRRWVGVDDDDAAWGTAG